MSVLRRTWSGDDDLMLQQASPDTDSALADRRCNGLFLSLEAQAVQPWIKGLINNPLRDT